MAHEWYVWKYHNGHFRECVGPLDHNSAVAYAARLRRIYGSKNWTYSIEDRRPVVEDKPAAVAGVG